MNHLDKTTLESLQRVTQSINDGDVPEGKDAKQSEKITPLNDLEQIIEEGNCNFRVILRCNGRDPFSLQNHVKKPPLILALARHIPTDTFYLFAMSPHTVPC